MAINQGTTTLAVTTQERSWRFNIDTPKGGDPAITVWRQSVKTAPDGSTLGIDAAPTVQRNLSAIVAETQPFTPATAGVITGAELAVLLANRADMWRSADIAAAATGQRP